MNELELLLPSKELEFAALEYKKEHFDNQEYELYGSSLLDHTDSYDDWLNEYLNLYGGNIGYGVRPSERKDMLQRFSS